MKPMDQAGRILLDRESDGLNHAPIQGCHWRGLAEFAAGFPVACLALAFLGVLPWHNSLSQSELD